MKFLKLLVALFAVIIVVLLGVLIFYNPTQAPESTVAQPIISADRHLTVNSLYDGDLITSPLTVTGTVTDGGWFFEATFPVAVLDSAGNKIGIGLAQAQADWTSTGTVPFTAIINFSTSRSATGTVIFQNDNPSGDPVNAKVLSIQVRFR